MFLYGPKLKILAYFIKKSIFYILPKQKFYNTLLKKNFLFYLGRNSNTRYKKSTVFFYIFKT